MRRRKLASGGGNSWTEPDVREKERGRVSIYRAAPKEMRDRGEGGQGKRRWGKKGNGGRLQGRQEVGQRYVRVGRDVGFF